MRACLRLASTAAAVAHESCLLRRALACVVVALCCTAGFTAAQSGRQPAFPALASADLVPHHRGVPERAEAGGARTARATLDMPSLADAGEQIRRPDPFEAGGLAVVYPDIGEPYRSIFAKIIEGIEEGLRRSVVKYPVGPETDPAELAAQLRRNGTRAVIALGREGVKMTSALDPEMPVVMGGVLAEPEADNRAVSGISLMPDPALLFARLKGLLPGVKRVIVIYNPQYNDWLIRLAREAARTHGLELAAYEARDLASAARLYETAFAAVDGRRDAVWLPQDATTVDDTAILPLVLKEAWNRIVPVFSSSFPHVRKGALFALYPDNLGLGRSLAGSAIAAVTGGMRRHGVQPLREVRMAVNLRTASHIGLLIGYQQQRSFDAVFPEL